MTLRIAAVVSVAVVALSAAGAASPATTVTSAAVCKTFTVAGLRPKWSVIGNVTCSQAKPWLTKLLSEHAKPDTKLVFKDGPRGFKCSAFVDKHGRPSVGSCYTGTIAFPKNGFQWLA